MVNKGYAVFALVDMVERNGDYCIVSTSGSKIELYDRIILNSDTVKEGQVFTDAEGKFKKCTKQHKKSM